MSDIEFVNEIKEPANDQAEHKARIERCTPVAKKLLAILNEGMDSVILGENADVKKSVEPLAEKVLAMFLQENINWMDRHVIIQLALQPLSSLGETLTNATEISWDRALTQLWGKDALDLKISDVHDILTKITPTA